MTGGGGVLLLLVHHPRAGAGRGRECATSANAWKEPRSRHWQAGDDASWVCERARRCQIWRRVQWSGAERSRPNLWRPFSDVTFVGSPARRRSEVILRSFRLLVPAAPGGAAPLVVQAARGGFALLCCGGRWRTGGAGQGRGAGQPHRTPINK